MTEEKIRYKTRALVEAVRETHGKLYDASRKLGSIGDLLTQQNEDAVVDLHGLGFILNEIGEEFLEMWRTLDTANFTRR